MPGRAVGSGLGVGDGATDGGSLKDGAGASKGGSSAPPTGLPPGGKLPGWVGAKLQAVSPNINNMLSACKLLMAALPFKSPRLVAFSLTAEQYSGIYFPLKEDSRPSPQGVPVLARSPRWLPWSLILCFALPVPAAARGLPHGGVGQEGTQVPDPGMPEIAVGSRFAPMEIFGGTPDLSLRVGAWSNGSLGLDYARSGMLLGNPHELEFSLKQALLSEQRGHPLSASLMGAVNTGAYSIDGELALSRRLGPLTMLGTARLLGNAEGARLPLGGLGMGAEFAVRPGYSLIGDVFQVANLADASPAWGAGLRMHLPQTPYAATVYLTNTSSASRQGASLGTPDLRLGIALGMAFGGGTEASKPPAEPVAAPRNQAPAAVPRASLASARQLAGPTLSAATADSPSARTKPLRDPGETERPSGAPPAPRVAAQAPRAHELWIVMIRDGMPSPGRVQLAKGSSVTWFNRDAKPHAWTANGWETGVVEPGKQITRRFERAGTFAYRCRLHPGEGGTITVR